MDVALPAFARYKIEFEIGICARRCAHVIERSGSQRRAPEIRVKDHAGGVDEPQQRVTQRLAELTIDRFRQASERELQRFFVHLAAGNLTAADFLSKTAEAAANTFGDCATPVA